MKLRSYEVGKIGTALCAGRKTRRPGDTIL